MKVAVLSDAHGNDAWTKRCLEAVNALDIDATYFLGDAVGYLPDGDAVIDLLRAHGATSILGNHEAMMLGRIAAPTPEREDVYRLREALDRLSPENRDDIESWPEVLKLEVGGKRLVFVHGSPCDHFGAYVYPDADISAFEDPDVDVLFMGNTHRPFVRLSGSTLVVNPGSCGLPRDQGDSPSFAVYDTVSATCEVLRLKLNGESMARQASALGAAESVVALFRRTAATVVGRTFRTDSG